MSTHKGRCVLCASEEWLSGDTLLCSHCGRVVRLGTKAAEDQDAAAVKPQDKPEAVYGADARLCRLPVTRVPPDCKRWVLHGTNKPEYAWFVLVYADRVEWWLAGTDGKTVFPLYLQRIRRTGRP